MNFTKEEISLQTWKKRSNSLYLNKDWLYTKYLKEKRTAQKMAKLADCTQSTILRYLRIFNIPIRTRSEARSMNKCSWLTGVFGNEHPNWKGGSWSFFHQEAQRAWEKYWGEKVPGGYLVHHVDGDEANNYITNLALITCSYHAKIHNFIKNIKGEQNAIYY